MSEVSSKKKIFEISTSNAKKLEAFVKLSEELTNYLTLLKGRLSIQFNPASNSPEVLVIDAKGEPICEAKDLDRVSGYRKFLTKTLKEKDLKSSSETKLQIVSNLQKRLTGDGPEKILQENHQKFVQMKVDQENLIDNLERLKELPKDDYQEYLVATAERLDIVLVELMIQLVGATKVTTEERDKALLDAKIPKWIYSRLLQKNWVKSDTEKAKSLLFPKGNFLKGVSLSSVEIETTGFIQANKTVAGASETLFSLKEVPEVKRFLTVSSTDAATSEALKQERGKFGWTLVDPDGDELLAPRLQGKNPPQILVEKPKKKGRGPVNQVTKLRVEQRNRLKMFVDHFHMITHGVILLPDPVEQFWSKILTKTDAWVVTPDKSIYDHIAEDEDHKKVFSALGNPGADTMEVILHLLFMKIDLVMTDSGIKKMAARFQPPKTGYKYVKPADVKGPKYSDILDTSALNETDIEKAKKFLGQKKKKLTSSKGGRGDALPLTRDVKEIITGASVKELRDISTEVLDWIATSFKESKKVRKMVALLILGAFERQEDLTHEEEEESESEDSDGDGDY